MTSRTPWLISRGASGPFLCTFPVWRVYVSDCFYPAWSWPAQRQSIFQMPLLTEMASFSNFADKALSEVLVRLYGGWNGDGGGGFPNFQVLFTTLAFSLAISPGNLFQRFLFSAVEAFERVETASSISTKGEPHPRFSLGHLRGSSFRLTWHSHKNTGVNEVWRLLKFHSRALIMIESPPDLVLNVQLPGYARA